jgi:hypothetical protein
MKLLFLSTCGKTKEPEDTSYINLYLASLKRHVVPHYDVKVILFNNALNQNSSESLTWQRVKDFGLENVVEVKNLYEMGLPQKSVEFLDSQYWFGKIGLNMNMLFDYSRMNSFFGADWIFHFDTDLEFLDNFKTTLDNINPLTNIGTGEILITAGGDNYPYNMRYQNIEFIFDEPTRINFYDDSTLEQAYNIRKLTVNRRNNATDATRYEGNEKLFFNLQQQKIRNDFVGFSKNAANNAHQNSFNWIGCNYPADYEAIAHLKDNEDAHLLKKLWDEKVGPNFELVVNHDKGSIPQYFLQGSNHNIVKIQVRGYSDMARHYSSGWYAETTFRQVAKQILFENYTDSQHIWEKNYLTKEEIESRISNLQNEIQRLQSMLN